MQTKACYCILCKLEVMSPLLDIADNDDWLPHTSSNSDVDQTY